MSNVSKAFAVAPDDPESVLLRPQPEVFTPEEWDRVLAHGLSLKASDITIQPGQPVWAEIAGRWMRLTARPVRDPEVNTLIRMVYRSETGLALLKAGKDLDPSYECIIDGVRRRFRVNLTSGRFGIDSGVQLTLRSLPTQPVPIEALQVEPPILQHFRPLQGMNLVCGPTGSGKSTLLSSLIRWRCEQKGANEKVIEYSRPIEYVFDGLNFPDSFVWQTEIGRHLSPDEGEARSERSMWAYAVRNALRRKPSIIVVGEARDAATIAACIEGALTGHLVVSTLHTIGVPETIRRLLSPFEPRERETMAVDLMQVLNLVVTQILVPRVDGGRIALREFLVFTPEIRRLLTEEPFGSWPELLRRMMADRPDGLIGQTMAAAATAAYARGQIARPILESVLRQTGTSHQESALKTYAKKTRDHHKHVDNPTIG